MTPADYRLVPLTQGKYAMDDRITGERIGTIRRCSTVKSFAIWDAYDAYEHWLRGYPTRAEAEWALVRKAGGSP